MEWDRRLPADLVEGLWTCPDQYLAKGCMLKRGERSTVVRFSADDGDGHDAGYVLKRFRSKGPIHSAMHCLLRTRARRGWKYGHLLRSAGVRTPLPLAYREDRIGPVRHTSCLLTRYVPGVSLHDYLETHADDDTEGWHQLAREFADLWNRLGESRITHGDLKAPNVIIAEDLKLWLIDLDATSRHALEGLWSFRRARDWERFLENFEDRPALREIFEAHVLFRAARSSKSPDASDCEG
jgi:tRNA A-37 threonylcarbamoyl transferase component Bud32